MIWASHVTGTGGGDSCDNDRKEFDGEMSWKIATWNTGQKVGG